MDRRKKSTQTMAPVESDTPRMKLGIGQKETTFSPVVPQRKRGWSDAQWEQSKKFWHKKNEKSLSEFKAQGARTVHAEDSFLADQVQQRKDELAKLSAMKVVSGGKEKRMPDATSSVLPKAEATRNYKDVVHDIGEFLDPHAPVRSTFNEGGPQLIQQFTNPSNVQVTRRVGVDVEDSSHVESLKPHLNLQTQHDGKVQKDGALKDPHHPVRSFDPFRSAPGGKTHPLMGRLTSDEKRAFMERYVHSLGIPIKRQ